jgi:hypothetical protein
VRGTWFNTAWQRGSADPSPSNKTEILGLLAKAGCMFCADEAQQVQTFFFWYLAEQYFEAHGIEQMQR